MVKSLLALILMVFLNVKQGVNLLKLSFDVKFDKYEISDFPYEGVLIVDLQGVPKIFEGQDKFANSFLKEVTYKRTEKGALRVILKFSGAYEILNTKVTSRGLEISISPKVSEVEVVPLTFQSSTKVSSTEKIQVVKEMVKVELPKSIILRCKDTKGEVLSRFIKMATGLDVNLKSDSLYNLYKSFNSEEAFLKSFGVK